MSVMVSIDIARAIEQINERREKQLMERCPLDKLKIGEDIIVNAGEHTLLGIDVDCYLTVSDRKLKLDNTEDKA